MTLSNWVMNPLAVAPTIPTMKHAPIFTFVVQFFFFGREIPKLYESFIHLAKNDIEVQTLSFIRNMCI